MLFGGKIAGHQPRQEEEDEAMSKKLKVAGPATNEEIGAAYQASRGPHERERLLAIRMGQQGGWTCEKIAHTLGRGRDTIGRGGRAYRQRGDSRVRRARDKGG